MPYKLGVSRPDPNPHLDAIYRPLATASDLPAQVAYDSLFGPVGDQGQVGTCVGWGTTAVLAAFQGKRTHTEPPVMLSPRALYAATKFYYESGDTSEGLVIADALNCLKGKGWVRESDWPYGAADEQSILVVPPSKLFNFGHDVQGATRVPADPTNMRLALFEHGPLVIGVNWPGSWFNPDSEGFLPDDTSNPQGGHCIAVIGYSDTKAAFHIRNSWGTGWGVGGYAWLKYDSTAAIWDCWCLAVPA